MRTRLGQRLYDERTARGITLEQLEFLTGIKASKIGGYEQGKFLPAPEALEAIAQAIGCRLDIVRN